MAKQIDASAAAVPPTEVIKTIQKRCWEEMQIRLPKKDAVTVLKKTEEAKEAEDLLDRALHSNHGMSEKQLEEFRELYESHYKSAKKLSNYEMKEAAQALSVIAMMQKEREAGAAIRALMIKHKKIEITNELRAKLKKLFHIAFNIELTDIQIGYYLKLSFWFVWYKEGLSYSLDEALNNLVVHYDKKKRGKRGSLQPKDYDLGYFYRWLDYIINESTKDNNSELGEFKEMTLKYFIKWMDKEYHPIRSFLAGDECRINDDGTYTMAVSLKDWE